ncbi:hypothetical protein Smic_57090 [Streptomyces microflavus]|uniref:Diaminopimelate decarboxylase n=1 Tax=Streptomyces microflavus TaxID=1919 RepID=A0A7J0CXI8_STRMI|nr:hypothetical protein Smic_57090 [Streptomyces microflavus]
MSRSAHPAGPRHADVMTEGHYSAPAADLNVLDEKVWARTVTRDADGALTVGGIAVARLAEEFGTPPTSSTRATSAPGAGPGPMPSGRTPTSSTPERPSSPAPSCAGCRRRG